MIDSERMFRLIEGYDLMRKSKVHTVIIVAHYGWLCFVSKLLLLHTQTGDIR